MSQEAEGQERRAGDEPPASFPLRPAPESQQCQRRHRQHKALVLHDAAKANEIPVDRQEQRGNLPVPPVEPAPAQQVEGHDAQKTGEREGQPGLPFVDRARECPGGHGEQDLGGTLLVIEQLCIVPQDSTSGSHHHDALVALELAVAQMGQAEKRGNGNDTRHKTKSQIPNPKSQIKGAGGGEDEDEYEHIDGGQQRGKGQGARDVME